MACDYCCFVDGSWISLANRTGIGWVLYNKNAKFVLRGMASISPLGTPIEVEAEALRMAMVHLKRLGYHRVTFCGDNSVLFQNINVLSDTQQQQCWEYSSISTHLQDIQYLAQSYNQVSFFKVPRVVNNVADRLAKFARLNNLGLVISWNDVS
ncbi:unnamed protein product [Arabidopsis lyrata]|nr:unnamed protein product [Arabidopsis lyrata]